MLSGRLSVGGKIKLSLIGITFFYKVTCFIDLFIIARQSRQSAKNFSKVVLGNLGFMPWKNTRRKRFCLAGESGI